MEEYRFPAELSYEVFDHPASSAKPSSWQTMKQAMDGHVTSTANLAPIVFNGVTGMGSLAILRFKTYFDTEIKFTFMAATGGSVGICFRFKNPFNTYMLVFDEASKAKIVKKVVNNEVFIINSIDDGGYEQGKWYKVILTVTNSIFDIKFGEDAEDDADLKSIMVAEDQEFASGRVGYMSNGVAGAYFDNLEITPIECTVSKTTNPDGSPKPITMILPPQCSRFNENYFGQMELRWKAKEPMKSTNGPSKWEFASNLQGKAKVIYQSTKIASTGPDQSPAFLEFIGPKE